MCVLMGKRLAVFWTVFIYFKVFGVKMQKSIKEKMVLRVVILFYFL